MTEIYARATYLSPKIWYDNAKLTVHSDYARIMGWKQRFGWNIWMDLLSMCDFGLGFFALIEWEKIIQSEWIRTEDAEDDANRNPNFLNGPRTKLFPEFNENSHIPHIHWEQKQSKTPPMRKGKDWAAERLNKVGSQVNRSSFTQLT